MKNQNFRASIKLSGSLLALFLALTVNAREIELPLPVPSRYSDRESSTNVVFSGWNDATRYVTLTIETESTPTNALRIAFGRDTNGNGNLDPEETAKRIGPDCQVLARKTSYSMDSDFSREWNLVKITSNNGLDPTTRIRIEFKNNPFVLLVR